MDNIKVLTLDSIATLKSLIGSGGGGGATLLNEYTDSPTTTDAYSATYINNHFGKDWVVSSPRMKLNPEAGAVVLIGSSLGGMYSSTTSYFIPSNSIFLGTGTATRNPGNNTMFQGGIGIGNWNIESGSMAIGYYDTKSTYNRTIAIGSETIVSHGNSVVLGTYSTSSRESEFSIGKAGATEYFDAGTWKDWDGTRFIANVKAGTLPTDAVNLQQVQDMIEAISSGGTATLYSEYGTNTDGALTQAFVSEKLNGSVVVLGQGASAQTAASAPSGIAIGYQAKALSSSGQVSSASIAIGEKALAGRTSGFAQAVAIGFSTSAGSSDAVAIGSSSYTNHNSSVALGASSRTSRSGEVSIGFPQSTLISIQSRYLANVRTGTLDTDATNVGQVRSAVQGTTLYEGTASVNTLELSETADNFTRLQIVGQYTGMGSSAVAQTVTVDFYPTETAKSFQVTATDITVGDTPMMTTLQDIWMLSDDGTDLDLVSSTKAEQGAGTLTCTPDTTSQFTIVKVIGFGKV